MLNASIVSMLWWHAASRRGHHMLECPGNSSSEEASSSAADPAVETARANSRDVANSRSTATLTGRPNLGWSTANSSEHHAALLQHKGAWAENARDGLLVRHGPDQARKISSGTVRLEPGRKPNNTSRRASRLPGGGVPGHLSSSDLRNHATTVRATHDADH